KYFSYGGDLSTLSIFVLLNIEYVSLIDQPAAKTASYFHATGTMILNDVLLTAYRSRWNIIQWNNDEL
ncbi:hypothetical protein ACFPLE_004370, partial [Salmonella enterica]